MFSASIYKRYTPAIIPPAEENESAWWFIFNDNKLLIKMDGDNISIPHAEDFDTAIDFVHKTYIGQFDGNQCYCMGTAADIYMPHGMQFEDLRFILGQVDEDMFLLAGRAFQIVNWNRINKFCGRCGAITDTRKDEMSKVCPACGHVIYPRISPAVIVAVTKDDKILLAHNKNFRNKMYSHIAGFVEPGETFEDCVKREVMEEVGIKVKNLNYFGSQPWPFPDSIMIAFTAEYESGEILADGIEICDAGWYSGDNLPNKPSKDSIAGHLIAWFLEDYSQRQRRK